MAAILLAAASASAAGAWIQAGLYTVTSAALVAGIVERARQEVLVATDVLRSREVAESLRRALRRGVAVYILTTRSGLRDPNGYLLSLAMAGARVRFADLSTRALIVDGRYLIVGPHLAGLDAPDGLTLILDALPAAAEARTRFLAAWEKGGSP